ncbi:helix-turn-helix transcriptional regulator [Paenibacillus sacheonensis]|uniref:Helix-turn-helix domain-containing protein n=1 Tax=Paenibacillus sacheonensis TaxID=742054 RepID=A0A7X4YUB0_9BACL|nr:AraC family transcriptional regulator [Paenibacillus sacheonensis]MBM7568924.1 AraC family transcriptional regulator of arabinose operon [Paenibacillus sacheonensis]NBC72701.1 helix-turn-helix domain-containing protein [Paenibacillus sacheonensis]
MFDIFDIRQERGILKNEQSPLGSDSFTLVWIRFGQTTYRLAGQASQLHKNDLLLIPAGVPAAEMRDAGSIRESVVVRFSPADSAAARLLPLLARRAPLRWVTHMPELLLEKLLYIVEQWTARDRYFSVMCGALLTELIVTISREYDEGEKAPSSIHHIEVMKRYIEDHYRGKITKNELGGCIGVSPNYAASLFRSVTGMTISEYVHRRRMKTAVYMLRHSQLTARDISEHLGYSDPSFFNRTFKRIIEQLPSDLIAERSDRE